eukprot:CAMPEP_0206568286 /NCGR_PEP_ID=MMETSP0325_2-20121206/25753_1 /ASSEMBLY_ACC=CAM_ASM_000347 /TAXON_ID=2866 /ORGANISM="Crypthecodinium cohnii, Strain Seligo" /LENGTH=331 /DNA_ID=CAMNT_0054071657 /DNA_START=58 /DNA_END=1053 /DNA_ORIENTATION=+
MTRRTATIPEELQTRVFKTNVEVTTASQAWYCSLKESYTEGLRRMRLGDHLGAASCLEACFYNHFRLEPPPEKVSDRLKDDDESLEARGIPECLWSEIRGSKEPSGGGDKDGGEDGDAPADQEENEGEGGEQGDLNFDSDDSEHGGEVVKYDSGFGDDSASAGSDFGEESCYTATSRAGTATPNSTASPHRLKELGQYEKQLPLQLCLNYARIEAWQPIELVVQAVLDQWDLPMNAKGVPRLLNQSQEERWVKLMTHRGVACAFLGFEHFPRARGAFELILRVQPRNRDAKRGVQCLQFLESQLGAGGLTAGACSSALSALAASVTPSKFH